MSEIDDAIAKKLERLTTLVGSDKAQEIVNQDLEAIFTLETDLFPCLVAMRHKGVRVDENMAHKYIMER